MNIIDPHLRPSPLLIETRPHIVIIITNVQASPCISVCACAFGNMSANSPVVPTSKRKRQELQRTYGKKTRMLFQLPLNNNNNDDDSDEEMFFPDTDKIDLNSPPKVPTRPAPRSQKEATMAAEPPEDAVQILLGLGKTDNRDVVVRYLKVWSNGREQQPCVVETEKMASSRR